MSFDHEISRVFRSSFPSDESTAFRTNAWREGIPERLEPLYPTMLHAFAQAARRDNKIGITLLADRPDQPERHKSYRELYHAAMSAAARLRDHGVRAGDRVVIVLPTSFELITSFFAVQLLDAIPVPSYPPAALERAPRAIERLRHVVASSGAQVCVTDRKLRALLGQLTGSGGLEAFVTADTLASGDRKSLPKMRPRGSSPAFIQYTSGSTDRPKGVLLSQRNLVMNIHAMGLAMRITRADRGASWLPLYHDMGLIGGLLTSIYWHMPLALMSPLAFMADPLRWLQTIDAHRATISPAPNFAYALCARRAEKEPARIAALDLSSWRVALNGAESVNHRVLREFQATFGPKGFRSNAMLPVYGLAESSLAVSFPPIDEDPHWQVVDRHLIAAGHAVDTDEDNPNAMVVVSVGHALPGHELIVVDEHGEELPEREVGHVVVRGPSIMEGYWEDPENTEAVLADGTLWTGDLGYVFAGQLYITGRAKDLIIVRGRNYYSEDLERIAAQIPGVRGGGVVAFAVQDDERESEIAVMVCETRATDGAERESIVRQVSEAVAENSGIQLDEVVLAEPGTIPKTSSGKPQRSLTRQRYLDGTLGREKTGKLGIALVFVRSGAGFLASGARKLLGNRRAPE
jgi:acyl-CoA synthetase (AMP-forming)/AMP-acid ligase II